MFSHVMVGANDLDASTRFYDAALGALGIPPGRRDDKGRVFYRTPAGAFAVTKPIDGGPASGANGGTACEDPPGVREVPQGKLHLAYLRDPAGNKLCVLHRAPASLPG